MEYVKSGLGVASVGVVSHDEDVRERIKEKLKMRVQEFKEQEENWKDEAAEEKDSEFWGNP